MNKKIFPALLAASLIGGASHAQPPQQPDITIGAVERKEAVGALIREIEGAYVYPDLAKKIGQALQNHDKHGDYSKLASAQAFADALTRDMQKEVHDPHLYVAYSADPLPPSEADSKPSPEDKAQMLAMNRAHNFGVDRAERLPFNIGYVSFEIFAGSKDAAPTLAAMMTLVAHTDALIIDLRENHGGDSNTVGFLASYLFDERTHLDDIYFPKGDRLEQMWTNDYVEGLRYGQSKPVYILTSPETVSAAEDFAYSLKNLKRAVIVGETTAGGAHPGDFVRIGEHFQAFVSNGRSISPVTKTDWEGTGVTPDIAVSAADALKAAQQVILQGVLATEKSAGRQNSLKNRIAELEKNPH